MLGRFGPRVKRPRPLTAAEAAGIMFGEEYDGTYGAGMVVDHLVAAGIVERVFREVESGREVEGPDLPTFMVGMTADGAEGERWRAWAEKTAIGYRLARVTP